MLMASLQGGVCHAKSGFGNLGRNSIIGPGFEDIDTALDKGTRITARLTAQFRVDAFSLFNHPNFGQIRPRQVGRRCGRGKLLHVAGVEQPYEPALQACLRD
jgi:hypothetical protein